MFEYNGFKIIEDSFNKDKMRFSESIMSIGNEYMGMRGNFEEGYSGDSMKGTYIGGVWYPDKTRVGWWKNGYPQYFGKVINSPNFIGIEVNIDDKKLDLNSDKILSFHRELDMKEGVLRRNFVVEKDIDGKKSRFEVKVERFLSIDIKEVCVIRYEVKPLDVGTFIRYTPFIDANVKNEDSNYEEVFWEVLESESDDNSGYIIAQTKANDFGVERFSICDYMVSKVDLVDGDVSKNIDFEVSISEGSVVSNEAEAYVEVGSTLRIEKYVAVTTTRDYDAEKLSSKAREIANIAYECGYDKLLEKHSCKWADRWDKADVVIKNNPKLQQGIRYNIFQLFSTYYGEDSRLNIGPKGYTGEKYGGATYWDTEAYIVPMYLSIVPQEVTRNLLMYRYNQLKEAYHNASMQGLDGALYPMVTFNGIECHNEWEITFEEIHRNGAIAYAIYNYTNYTGDYEYVKEYGIEVLVGISKFWADRVHYSKEKGMYMMHGVTGPNEYENNINNNWYTNRMATWTLRYTIEVLEKFDFDYSKLSITEEEISKWKDIIENMYFPYDENRGVFVQHDTFLDKDLMTVDKLRDCDRPLNQNWSWDRILRSCFIKQADVLQGIYLFGNEFSIEEKKKNYDFYEPMTVHESSLSACIHSILACEIDKKDKAVEMYERTARLDLDNINNDTDDGLHITSMSGSWLSIVQGFGGLKTFDEKISFSPILPKGWDGYSFKINYRDRLIKLDTSDSTVSLYLEKGDKIEIDLYGETIELSDKIERRMKS